MSGQYVEALVQKSNVVPDDVSSAFDSGNMLILICLKTIFFLTFTFYRDSFGFTMVLICMI